MQVHAIAQAREFLAEGSKALIMTQHSHAVSIFVWKALASSHVPRIPSQKKASLGTHVKSCW